MQVRRGRGTGEQVRPEAFLSGADALVERGGGEGGGGKGGGTDSRGQGGGIPAGVEAVAEGVGVGRLSPLGTAANARLRGRGEF